MTPNQRHNRRMMVQLLVMAAAILALSVGEDMRAERDAQSEQGTDGVPRAAMTYVPGSRAVLPSQKSGEEGEPGTQAFLQVVSAAEFQNWLDSSASAKWDAPVSDCLVSWWLLDQGIEGNLRFEFVINAEGLQEVAVVHHQGVPLGPAECLSKVFHAQSWPTTSGEAVVAVQDLAFSNKGTGAFSSGDLPIEREREENRFREGGETESGHDQ